MIGYCSCPRTFSASTSHVHGLSLTKCNSSRRIDRRRLLSRPEHVRNTSSIHIPYCRYLSHSTPTCGGHPPITRRRTEASIISSNATSIAAKTVGNLTVRCRASWITAPRVYTYSRCVDAEPAAELNTIYNLHNACSLLGYQNGHLPDG